MDTKDKFHKLIDRIDDERILAAYFELIQRLNLHETANYGKVYPSLRRTS